MTEQIPASHLDLFRRPVLGHLATIMPDGGPQVTPIWVDYDGSSILVNTAQGRRKEQNMRLRPQVAIDIVDPDDPYRWIAVRGRIVEVTTEGADDHIDKLSQRYEGVEKFPHGTPNEVRVIFKINPERVSVWHGKNFLPHARRSAHYLQDRP